MIICPKTQTFCQIQKICLDRIFNPEKEDMSRKDRTYGNTKLINPEFFDKAKLEW